MERLTVDTDTSPDTGEYFFNLSCSSLPEIEGVFRFNNLINSLSGSVSFGLPFYVAFVGYMYLLGGIVSILCGQF